MTIDTPNAHARETFARQIARVFATWRRTYPLLHFTEETLRQICQRALTMYESDGKDGKDMQEL